MTLAMDYQEPILPWDDSARHNSILKFITLPLIGFFVAVIFLTQSIDVPKLEHSIQRASPEQLARWLQDAPTPVKKKPTPIPKPVTPEVIKSKPTPKPKAIVKKQPSPKPAQPAPTKPSKPSARKRAEQHATVFSAFNSLTQVNQDQALQGDPTTLQTTAKPDLDTPTLQPTLPPLSNRSTEIKTHLKSRNTTLVSSTRTQISTSSFDDSSSTDSSNQSTTKKLSESTADINTSKPKTLNTRNRSDIQRIFNENKTSIYSIYHRALRSNPTLKGTLVLALHIAPSGKVTKIDISNSDLGNAKLEKKLMLRVKRINFGAKDVTPWSGQYPIELLPTAV